MCVMHIPVLLITINESWMDYGMEMDGIEWWMKLGDLYAINFTIMNPRRDYIILFWYLPSN
jgi:hypothetical protein